ncbi:MAG: mechanosensitive ion channel family protein [Sphingomonadaceae bacterium]
MRFRPAFGILAALALTAALPAQAALPIGEVTEEVAPPETEAPIEAEAETGSDERIAARLEGIYGQLPGLAQVTVTAREGVVVLRGTVGTEKDRQRARDIAGRVEGVVAVRNDIERDVSLDSSMDTLGGVTDKVQSAISLLPFAGLAILVGLLIAAVGYLLAAPGAFWRKIAPNGFLAELLRSAIRFSFVIFGIVVALDMIGAGALMGAVLGGAGVIGLALGFAMRDTVENYVASVMLSLRQPFRANDWVVIGDMEGRVIRLTSRATILMTLDGNHLRIPNNTVFKSVILNYTTNPQRRFEFDLGIDADDDANAGRGVGRAALAALPFVLDEPAPEARVVDVGDSNIVLRFLGWIDQREADWYKARSRAIAAVKKALEDGGFALPEPIYRLRFDPRTQPLPFENVEHKAPSEPPAPAPAPAPGEEDHDVTPQDEIAEMVEQERAGEKGGDLLDPNRPVE